MKNEIEELFIVRIDGKGKHTIQDLIVREFPLTIILNDRKLVTLLCSPSKLEYLTLGFLLSAGLIEERGNIKTLTVDEQTGMAKVETKKALGVCLKQVLGSSGGLIAGLSKPRPVNTDEQFGISASAVFSFVEDFLQRSSGFKNTGALHSAALCHKSGIIISVKILGDIMLLTRF